MYDTLPPRQAAALRKGAKIRGARAILGLAQSLQNTFPESFMQHELDQIKEIADNVITRAETVLREELKANSSEACRGAETVERTFNGK